jgi:hypothetical protein
VLSKGALFCLSELTALTFEPATTLRGIDAGIFCGCHALESFCIPAGVQTIGNWCFTGCRALSQLVFESDSHFTGIGRQAFENCSALATFCIPAQVEQISEGSFNYCASLVELTFESLAQLIFDLPSRLRQFDVPPSDFGSLCIPDSVEILSGHVRLAEGQSHQSPLAANHASWIHG